MNDICEKIRRAIPEFPDCKYPWDVLNEMKNSPKVILPRRTVEGFNNSEVYADPDVEIQPYCLFAGLVILDKGVRIGPYSLLRGPIYIGRNSLVGPHAEIIRCLIMDNTSLAHKNLMGDSIFGDNINFGGMSVCCNMPVGRNMIKRKFRGEESTCEEKYGSFVGNNSSLGCLTIIMPGCFISENSKITGQCIVYGNGKVKNFVNGVKEIKVSQ
jgi:NDP-sugar pyrophosphorylase family protein